MSRKFTGAILPVLAGLTVAISLIVTASITTEVIKSSARPAVIHVGKVVESPQAKPACKEGLVIDLVVIDRQLWLDGSMGSYLQVGLLTAFITIRHFDGSVSVREIGLDMVPAITPGTIATCEASTS